MPSTLISSSVLVPFATDSRPIQAMSYRDTLAADCSTELCRD